MKLMDKLKNALFEEEYVEVEEKPKKGKKKEKKVVKQQKESVAEKPIAKKIVLPERKEVKVTSHESQDTEEKEEISPERENNTKEEKNFKFPMVSDSEFTYQKEEKFKKPKVDSIESTKREEKKAPPITKEKKSKPYGIHDLPIREPEYGSYEKKEDKSYFKPSPIISPIYGILDKNYKREDVVQKREVRLTSTYARESLDVDEVRNRAYGSLSDELMEENNMERESPGSIMDNDLLDLSVDGPKVNKVTVGDAEEYFEDLGLEYNVDYKDEVGQNKQTEYQETGEEDGPYLINEEKTENKVNQEKEENIVKRDTNSSDDLDEDNLFDLIDSMYDND